MAEVITTVLELPNTVIATAVGDKVLEADAYRHYLESINVDPQFVLAEYTAMVEEKDREVWKNV
ncbi:hypothetical protein ACQ34_gp51 [Pseudomonas phage YH6]|uniref:Uncharacterized protein n=1 Tax=Pseudomonas phage YH6 TaxID=1566995 RepID=A0A0A0YSM5_9CAUD|nr:hypothetical protein ACQ34_gp51 [Pseudomonas phage YH6]AIX13204.1 hypothetical protein YH6_051 [Pseudomonas phage YH6]